uniref:Photosystem II extrinsic protein n=1 Tax=Galdieria sulphuraria TaxID=130081 RepID=D5KXJ1_GALSU|nr:photosystem II extrinsic protein [Galdieria sulphuraria]
MLLFTPFLIPPTTTRNTLGQRSVKMDFIVSTLPCQALSAKKLPTTTLKMQIECADPHRRKLLETLLTSSLFFLLPKNASAKSGESAKLSIFGVEGLSSPFTADLKSKGQPLYKNLNEEEISRYTKAITDGKASLSKIPGYINEKSWEDIKSLVRQRVADLRSAQKKMMASISEQRIRQKAEKLYDSFIKSIEDIDYAARQKNGDKVRQAQQQAMKLLQEWASAAGVAI